MSGDEKLKPWVAALGIVDRSSGIEQASKSEKTLAKVPVAAMETYKQQGGMTARNLVMLGLATRALGLHSGSVDALKADNPHATFTLIRAYAENTAAVEYAIEKPKAIDKLLGIAGASLPIGKIVSHANQSPSTRFGEFKAVYHQLSGYAHPTAKSVLTSANSLDEQGFTLSLTTAFKSDSDFLIAAAWIVEFANASMQMFAELIASPIDGEKIQLQFEAPGTSESG